jgi:hypothetical protein
MEGSLPDEKGIAGSMIFFILTLGGKGQVSSWEAMWNSKHPPVLEATGKVMEKVEASK